MRAINLNNNEINIKEPFKGLFTQGMVCHETYKDNENKWFSPDEVITKNGKEFYLKDNPKKKITVGPSESMSNSKKNTIDPQNIISQYGADAVRFFILADSPPERDVQWSDEGMKSSYKFIQKFWLLSDQIINTIKSDTKKSNEDINFFTNQAINKINQALAKFRYNVIIATYHEIYSYYKKIADGGENFINLKENFEKIILSLLPVAPHIANECLIKLNYKMEIKWPVIDKKYLIEENYEIVIQVNGKKRNTISVEKNVNEKEIISKIKENKLIEKYLNDGKLLKTIYVKNRLINYIIK
jgi:leucyl-tRNA synthetase